MSEDKPIRILFADDEQIILEAYQAVLSPDKAIMRLNREIEALAEKLFGKISASPAPANYELTLCKQAHEAIEAVQEAKDSGNPIAIAFLDVRMPPGKDGITAAEEIRKIDHDIEIVIVTGYSDVNPKEVSRRVLPAHKLLYVQKPFHPEEIFQFTKCLSAKWVMERKLKEVNVKLEGQVQDRTVELEEVNEQLKADIARRERAEQERNALQRQLQLSQKMEAIGTLAGGIAHDFNNLLGVVMGYTSVALVETEDTEALKLNLSKVMDASRRARELVQQILTFSRQHTPEKTLLKVNDIYTELVQFLKAALPSSVEIKTEVSDPKAMIEANATQMQQVLMNLATNASQAMNEQGVLEITSCIRVINSGADSLCPDLKPGTYLEMAVSDNGPGISDAIIDRIFDPYFTTKTPSKGTGMGLAVAHSIVKSHGGTICVDSKEGAGTTFRVLLPEAHGTEAATAADKIEIPRGTERILFVDDEVSLADLGDRMLSKLGYEVKYTTSAAQALEWFSEAPEKFDLVITDMTMPNKTGETLAIEMLSIRADIPIIICTGYNERLSPERADEIGAQALLMKPMELIDMATAVRQVLDKKKA